MFLSSFYDRLSVKKYSTICAIAIGFANLIFIIAYEASDLSLDTHPQLFSKAHLFTVESVIHSVNHRDPNRVGAHDGYYGMALSNVFYMISTLIVPSLNNYMRCKWLMVICALSFTMYFLSFQILHRYIYFVCCSFLGFGLASFNVGYLGYLTESSTKETISSNMALSWGISSVSVFAAGVVNFLMAEANSGASALSNYREYSDLEVRVFFAIVTAICVLCVLLYAALPNKDVSESISKTCERTKSVKEQISQMITVLVNKRILILAPYYLYIGIFFTLWISIIPTTFQFTMALSKNPYVPMLHGLSFTAGTTFMCILIMKLTPRYPNLCCKPMMIVTIVLHLLIFALIICIVPEWSTVRQTDEPALLIEPSIGPALVLAFLLGAADLANNNMRTVISSMVMPARRQHIFGVSRCYHAMAASVLLFAAPYLSIYAYFVILTVFLCIGATSYLYTCSYLKKEEKCEKETKESYIADTTDMPKI